MADLEIVRFEAADEATLQAALPAFFWADEQGVQHFGSVTQAVDGNRMDICFFPRELLQEAVVDTDENGDPVVVSAAVYAATIQAEVWCSAAQAAVFASHELRITD